MADMWRSDWVKKKGDVAAQLASHQCGGAYGDAAVILCSCLSALAAEVWPFPSVPSRLIIYNRFNS